ncbi:ribosomal RNA-processing protein 7-domain-containing protein [Chytridium lagenaria]|nr:ribosomal RNA-processing protein 7-domain-containing protein [Chytridium lagenaria]
MPTAKKSKGAPVAMKKAKGSGVSKPTGAVLKNTAGLAKVIGKRPPAKGASKKADVVTVKGSRGKQGQFARNGANTSKNEKRRIQQDEEEVEEDNEEEELEGHGEADSDSREDGNDGEQDEEEGNGMIANDDDQRRNLGQIYSSKRRRSCCFGKSQRLHHPTITMPPVNIIRPKTDFSPLTKHISKEEAEKLANPFPSLTISFRLHNTKASDADRYPKGRTLFLCNVPSDASERHFRQGSFSKRPPGSTVGLSGGHAHVVFFEEEAAQRALGMRARKEIEGDTPYYGDGLYKWVAMHQVAHPPLDQLEAEVNEFMERFEEMEEEKARQIAARRNLPDEDGFITVTKGPGRKGKAASEASMDKRDRKPKKKEVVDFYRFQMRETKRNQLAELKQKFEEDKSRIEQMKAKRKFKPY